MNQETSTASNATASSPHDPGQIAEHAQALMAATADVAGEKICQARKRLAAALDSAKAMAGTVRDQALAGAKAADTAVRQNPYQAVAIGVGLGVAFGYLLGRRGPRN
jgi:ElaB/YqjD/DUF883 family membrane-anchored ribosome-binding protein